jgi:hypothetical protein
MRRTSPLVVSGLVGVLLAAITCVGGPVSASPLASVRFRVLRPDQTPAGGAMVVTSLFGPGAGYASTVGPDGWVTASLLLTDPDVASAVSLDPVINVFIQVYDGYGVGDTDGNMLLLTDRFNLGDPYLPPLADFSGLNGQTFVVTPHALTFFEPDGEERPPSYDECVTGANNPPWDEMPVWICEGVDNPRTIENVYLPIADNYGAGKDMTTELELTYSKLASTSVGAEVGAELKAVEVQGKHSITSNKERVINYHWDPQGHGVNERALADTAWFRTYYFTCFYPDVHGPRECTPKLITYQPYDVVGSTSTPYYNQHDLADDPTVGPSWDCIRPLDGTTMNEAATSKGMSFSFKPNLNPEWDEVQLHTAVEFTGNTSTTVESKYTWRIDNDWALPRHHYYVPDGLNLANTTNQGDICPEQAPGKAYTQAADHDMTNPPADASAQYGPVVTDPGDPVIVCDVYPDRCGDPGMPVARW